MKGKHMPAYDNSEAKFLAWCIVMGCAMASLQLGTCLPLVVGIVAVLVGLYTAG